MSYVKKAIGNTYKEITNSSKDVVMLLYSNKCNKCTKFLNLYGNLSQALGPNENLLFSMINVDYNELPF
jgi:hypothetical protein